MISQGSVSFPVSSFSTSRRNPSFDSTRALCNQVAQSNSCPSLLLASFASSSPFVQPTCFSSRFTCGGRCSCIDIKQYAFLLDSGNRRSRNSSKDFRFSSRQYCPARTSHRYLPNSTKPVSFSTSFLCSQARISLILVSTNWARRRLSLGSIGGFLVMKLVKPIKAFRSWPPDESGLDQLLPSETKPNIRTAAARVLGETDAAVGQELARLDLSDGRFHQLSEFAPLLIVDSGAQVLDFDQPLAYENYLGDVGDSGDPRIANELRI